MATLGIIKFDECRLHVRMSLSPNDECHLDCAMLKCHSEVHDGDILCLIKKIMEVFMDKFSVYSKMFKNCLENLDKAPKRCHV
jgi:hypothetical protein